MKRTLLTVAVVGLAMLTAKDAFAGPFGWFRRRAAPAPVATVPAQGGTRVYSFEPGLYQPAPQARVRTVKPGYMDAGRKIRGDY